MFPKKLVLYVMATVVLLLILFFLQLLSRVVWREVKPFHKEFCPCNVSFWSDIEWEIKGLKWFFEDKGILNLGQTGGLESLLMPRSCKPGRSMKRWAWQEIINMFLTETYRLWTSSHVYSGLMKLKGFCRTFQITEVINAKWGIFRIIRSYELTEIQIKILNLLFIAM